MKKRRVIADAAMVVLLPCLMAYSLIGETTHEIIGIAMFALFILHHILNRKRYHALGRGRYTPRRIFRTVLDFLLLIVMLAQPLSGILLSKHLFPFFHVSGLTATAREIHLFLAYWGFVLLCVHAGTHLAAPVGKLRRRAGTVGTPALCAWAAISVYGCFAFVRRQFADYLFRRSAFVFFDFNEPRVYFFLDYLAMMLLFALLGCLVDRLLAFRKGGYGKTEKI